VLARIPDLLFDYQVAFNELGKCYPAYVQVYPDVQTDYYLVKTNLDLAAAEDIRTNFGLHPDVVISQEENYYPLGSVEGLRFYVSTSNSPPSMIDHVVPLSNDNRDFPYLVEPFADGLILSSMSLLFLVSFSAGMLVRYHPSRWADLMSRGLGDAVLPLLNNALTLVERRFPDLVLDEIEKGRVPSPK